MASITSPEQGAQQECSSTFVSPLGGVRRGRSNELSEAKIHIRFQGLRKRTPAPAPVFRNACLLSSSKAGVFELGRALVVGRGKFDKPLYIINFQIGFAQAQKDLFIDPCFA